MTRRASAAVALVAAACAGCAVAGTPTAAGPAASGGPTAAAPPAAGAPTAQSFTVVASGDVLIHPALTEQAAEDGGGTRDFGPLFAGVKSAVEGADLAICHLEVPLTSRGPYQGYPRFDAPAEVATALAGVGYDTCSTASNHTLDQGAEGVAATLDVLDRVGIEHTGSARTAAEAATPLVREVAGVRVGQVSFTFALNGGTSLPSGSPWMANNKLTPQTVIAAARAAREAGAEVVVASIHWGNEGQPAPTAEQVRIARALLADPAIDLIVGHHAHVVQPFEQVGGKWVAYGLGNHVAKHEEPKGPTEEGVIARFRFTRGPGGWTVDKAEYLPTLVDLGPPIRLFDLTAPTGGDPARRTTALDRTDEVVLSRGAADHGLTRPGG